MLRQNFPSFLSRVTEEKEKEEEQIHDKKRLGDLFFFPRWIRCKNDVFFLSFLVHAGNLLLVRPWMLRGIENNPGFLNVAVSYKMVPGKSGASHEKAQRKYHSLHVIEK